MSTSAVLFESLEMNMQPTVTHGKFKDYAQTLPTQLQNNFEEVQKINFSSPKIVKNHPLKLPKFSKF